MTLKTIREHRGSLYLTLGGALLGPALVAGCTDDAPTEQAIPTKGVITLIKETEPGKFVIEDEQVTDGPTRVVITRLDGKVEQLTDPDQFAQQLPQQAPPQSYAPAYAAGSGLGLGDLLLFSMVMNAWRPAYYPAYAYTPPRYVYASPSVYERVTTRVRPTFAQFQRRGWASTGASSYRAMSTRRAPGVRSTTPSRGRSGFGTSGRGFGGRSFGS